MIRIPVTAGLVAGLLGGVCVAAPWGNIGPGGGGWVPCMAVSPADSQVVYAGCDVGGFYRSLDAGKTWRIHNEGLQDLYVEVIAPHPRNPEVLYAGTEGGVHRSTNGGTTWRHVLDEQFIEALAVDPANADVIYAGANDHPFHADALGHGVFQSRNGGKGWTTLNDPSLTLRKIAALTVDPHRPTRLYAGTAGSGVFVRDLLAGDRPKQK